MDKAMEMLEQLASEMGVAVDYLWGVLVKNHYITGVICAIFAILSFVVLILIIRYTQRIHKHYKEIYLELKNDRIKNGTGFNGSYIVTSLAEDHARENVDNIHDVAIAIGVIMLVVFVLCTIFGVRHMLNPDYFALKDILRTISGVV